MVRTPSCDKSGLKRGTWTPEEDSKLVAYVTRYGCWNWRQLPRFAGLARCGKSCRLRWMNYLRPNIKRGNYTPEEEETIIRLNEKLGNKWTVIAAHLPGRTDNEIKNHWHTTLKRRFQKNSIKSEKAKTLQSKDCSPINEFQRDKRDAGPLSPRASSASSEFSGITTDAAAASGDSVVLEHDSAFLDAYIDSELLSEILWTDPKMGDFSNVPTETVPINTQTAATSVHIADACAMSCHQLSSQHLIVEDQFAFLDANSGPIPTTEDFWTQPFVADSHSHVLTQSLTTPGTDTDDLFPIYFSEPWSESNLYDECISFF